MSRPLDFIVYGVPRSGTKGLVHALNLHPHIYCAEERFHFRTNHSRLTFPQSFVRANRLLERDERVKIEEIAADLARKGAVRLAGNKLPRYFFALDRINREVPHLKNLWIYRSPYSFLPSWNAREASSEKRWPSGQIGLFGLLELLICIEASLRLSKDVFVFPHRHGLRRSSEIVLQAVEFLGGETGLYDREAFASMQRRQRERQRRRRKLEGMSPVRLQEYEEEILDTLHIRELDKIIERRQGQMISEIKSPLREFMDRTAAVLPGAIDRAFSACDNAAVRSFGRKYFRRNRAEFSRLLKITSQSKILVGFQMFGPYKRLKLFMSSGLRKST